MRSLSYYHGIVIRFFLFLCIIFAVPLSAMEHHAGINSRSNGQAGTLPLYNNNQNNTATGMTPTCITIDKIMRHPTFLLWPPLLLQVINNIVSIAKYPSADNCTLDSDFLIADSCYFVFMISALILIYKKK